MKLTIDSKIVRAKKTWPYADAIFVSNNPLRDGVKVRVMASAEGWAMVRRKGCTPFVVGCDQLCEVT